MDLDFELRFFNLPEPTIITVARIQDFISDAKPKRINFKTTHAKALSHYQDGNACMILPFEKTFEPIARKMLGLSNVLYQKEGKYGTYYGRYIRQADCKMFETFIKDVEHLVFLRDCLDLSIALSMHEYSGADDQLTRSPIGEHEYQIKYNPTGEAASEGLKCITEEFRKRLETLPYFREADYIMAVPSSHPFMQDVIKGITGFNFEDVSSKVKWKDKRGSLKNAKTPEEKLSMIDSWGFELDRGLSLDGKNVLLVDDMYQSGVTMQYVAMKLKEAGVKRVFGICICKALSNN